MIDFEEIQRNLIQRLTDSVRLIEAAEMPVTKETITMTSGEIKDESSIKEKASQLPVSGSHIYWFDVDEPSLLIGQFNTEEKSVEYKMARDNKGVDSRYVYVGCCTKTKLSNRFKQHCGWGNSQTYSLHLRKWLNETDLIFTFSYVTIENAIVAAQLEDQLHIEMKPLFGKPGANNKIKASL